MTLRPGSVREVFGAFLKLGLTSFGGPIAHIGYFRAEFVERRKWVSDAQFAQLLALCQFLPGPASSQLGFSLGLLRAGWAGALVAFVAFTLPSALAAYLGARLPGAEGGIVGATAALAAIFLPGFLILAGALPIWRSLASRPAAVRAVAGVNAAVVGLLGAALYDPVWTSAIRGPLDVAIAIVGLTLLVAWRVSALMVVAWCVGAAMVAAVL